MDVKDAITEFLEGIRTSGILVVVEGKKDVAALRSLGITNVKQLHKKPLYKVVEEIAAETKNCILLVDLDKEGRKLFGSLNSNLQRHGVSVDNRFREFLFRTNLRQIEGLPSFLKNLA